MDNVVAGQHDDGPLAVPGRLTDAVRHEGCLRQVSVVQTHFITGITVLQLRAEHLGHKMFIFDAVAHIGVIHLFPLSIRHWTRMTQSGSPLGEHPHLQLRPEID